MARSLLRIIALTNRSGDAFVGQTVTIRLYDKGTVTHTDGIVSALGTPFSGNVYAAETGGSTIGSTFTADANGRKDVWLENPDAVDVVISGSGISTFVYDKHRSEIDPRETMTESRSGRFQASTDGLSPDAAASDNRTALAATIARVGASATGKGEVMLPPGTHELSSFVSCTGIAGLSIRGAGQGATTLKLNSASAPSLIGGTGSVSSGVAVSGNNAEGSKTIALATGGVATLGLATGDLIYLAETAQNYTQLATVKSIATDTVTLTNVLYEAFNAGNGATCAKVTPLDDVVISDLTIDGSLASLASVHALDMYYTRRLTIRNVVFKDWSTGTIFLAHGYGTILDNVRLEGCGDANNPSIWLSNQTGMQITNLTAERVVGFAPDVYYCNGSEIANLRSLGTGRGIKLTHSSHNLFTNTRVENCNATGLSVVEGSHDNTFVGYEVVNTTDGNIWIGSNPGSIRNHFIGGRTTGGSNVTVLIDLTCDDNVVEGRFTTVTNNGARNSLRPTTFGWTGESIGSTSDATTPSPSYVDLDGNGTGTVLRVDTTTNGGNLVCTFDGNFSNTDVGGAVQVGLSLDGAAVAAERAISCAVANQGETIFLQHTFTGVSAGAHYVKVQWKVVTGTGKAISTRRTLRVAEGLRT